MRDIENKIKDLPTWKPDAVLKLAQDLLRQNAELKEEKKTLLDTIHHIWRTTK